MAFCAKCGATLSEGTTFCGSCGTPAGATGGGPAPAPGAPSPAAAGTGLTSNVAACLAYAMTVLTAILFLVLEPYNKDKFVRFHAFQSLFFGIGAVVLSIALMILTIVIGLIPIIGWIIDLLLWVAFCLGMFGAWIFLMYKAYNNEKYMLPFIGKLADEQAGKGV